MVNIFYIYMLQTAISISLFYLVYILFLRKETFFSFIRYYFIFGISLVFLLPFLNAGNLLFNIFPNPAQVTSPTFSTVYEHTLSPDTVAIPPVTSGITIFRILRSVYVAGVVFFLFRLVFQTGMLVRRVRRANIVSMLGSKIALDKKVKSPFSFFSWIFLNPDHMEEKSISGVIQHENEHIRQKHIIDLLLVEIICAFQWINPFVWFIRKAVKETHEYLADHAVLRNGTPVGDYQRLLLGYTLGTGNLSLITPLNFSLNKKRMIMMTKTKSPGKRKWKSLFLLPFMLTMAMSFTNPLAGSMDKSDHVSTMDPVSSENPQLSEGDVLYIVDGKPVSEAQFKKMDLKPESIESVQVFRGEKATKNYGARGRNGVVVITTKKKPGKSDLNLAPVTGKVFDAATGKPLPGVNIVMVHSQSGTVTDLQGNFSLPVNKEIVEVVFSYVGYKSQLLEVTSGKDIVVKLQHKIVKLDLTPTPAPVRDKTAQEDKKSGQHKTDKGFYVVEDMPRFPGGNQALVEYFSSTLRYPEKAKMENISGTVIVNFTVNASGEVSHVYVGKDHQVNPELDKEAIRVVSSMPAWVPGQQRGKKVPVELSLPVVFSL